MRFVARRAYVVFLRNIKQCAAVRKNAHLDRVSCLWGHQVYNGLIRLHMPVSSSLRFIHILGVFESKSCTVAGGEVVVIHEMRKR